MAAEKRRQRREMPRRKFLDDVWTTISVEWQDLIESEGLKGMLKEILCSRYYHFRPQPNGRWSAGPPWRELFAWTDCQIDDIRAIFIDMKPLRPNSITYQSTGFAFGVKCQPNLDHIPDISMVPSVWNMLRLVQEVVGIQWTRQLQNDLRAKFINGFNSMYLSRQYNMLFVQMQPVAGPKSSAKYLDLMAVWSNRLILPLIESVGRRNAAAGRSPIPTIQLYNRRSLEEFLDQAVGLHVFRPSFMNCDAKHGTKHVKGFTDQFFKTYVDEIGADKFRKHRQIFWKICDSIIRDHEDLTFTNTDILHDVI